MKNILYIFIFSFSVVTYGQESLKCKVILDSLTNVKVFKNPEKLPEPKNRKNLLMKEFVKQIKIETTANIEGSPEEKLIIGFIVCADGQVIGERIIMESPLEELEEKLSKVISETKWASGLVEIGCKCSYGISDTSKVSGIKRQAKYNADFRTKLKGHCKYNVTESHVF
ncbi:hypothetical protein H0I25_14095 [Cellulophaga sp. HaHa_2_95]|uniref:hypothetical protein n=1 Tax=unclassified Cellulophaga TaxID=2634405 RepID=UPI001C4FE17C|nr:hypothetical protein [Cellulophaga sp. HaHa_2_95]QXP55202.1 hypothetical protein H0I25_14095 [Cellulophaga sp. HaHa_2_95]